MSDPTETETESIRLFPGILLDERDQIVLAVLADDAVGISVRRFECLPSPTELVEVISAEEWITIYREDENHQMYLMSPKITGDMGVDCLPVKRFKGAEANESAQMAIEVALANWPEWGESLRDTYTPRSVIPLPRNLPEA